MKILCPEHQGLIEVPSKDLIDAFNSPVKILVVNCPICEENVLIQNIRLDNETVMANQVR